MKLEIVYFSLHCYQRCFLAQSLTVTQSQIPFVTLYFHSFNRQFFNHQSSILQSSIKGSHYEYSNFMQSLC